VSGYTAPELEQRIKGLIMKKYLKAEPVVTIRLLNFRMMVTGEVNKPGPVEFVNKDHVTLLDALTMAGDMTINGKRDDILLIREMPDGTVLRKRLDISKIDIISNPYYYLRQNDVIYVTPNRAKAQAADSSPQLGTVLSVSSFLVSLVSFVLLVTNR
jgi:polysaccharide export outer membrane protein